MRKKITSFLTLENVFVSILLVIALFLRVYGIGQNLAFHYDQGRDALVVWDLVNNGKFFLIGPTTGLAGVFRGPFYYYSIAPFYWAGSGNPIYPEVFLIFTTVVALFILYKLASEAGGRLAGLFSLIIGTFSFEIVYASRWLSNPTPMLLMSMLLVLSLFRIMDGNKRYWILLSIVLGLSFFNFGSSGELFYFLAIGAFVVWQILFSKNGVKKVPDLKIIILSTGLFILTFLPLFLFNLRHDNILVDGIVNQAGGKSFGIPTWRFVLDRLNLIWVYFTSIIAHNPYAKEIIVITFYSLVGVVFLPKVLKNDKARLVFIILLSPVVGAVFYLGNHGNFYQYYLTGYYLIFIMAVGLALEKIYTGSLTGKFLVLIFIMFFLLNNRNWIKSYIQTTGDEHNTIVLSTQKKSIDWVYKNSGGGEFNIDVYVPPVIPYSYDYLFKWLGTSKYGRFPSIQNKDLLFTLYEVDPDHPDRLKAWLDRQDGIGRLIKEESFGGITVQMRKRLKQ